MLAHELSHSFVARRAGIGVSRITLFVFGGVAQVDEEPRKATDELLISLAGPGMSLLLALVFGVGWWLVAHYAPAPLVVRSLERVAIANLVLAIFNMVPGFPLDGGRVLRALLWHYWKDLLRATRVASIMGQVVGYSLAGLGVFLGIQSGSLLLVVFYLGMGLLLTSMARVTYQRERVRASLTRVALGELAVPPELAFAVGTPLSVAAPYCHARQPRGWVPILAAQEPVGVLTAAGLQRVPPWQWPTTRVEEVMAPLREDMVLRHSRPAFEAVERMAQTGGADVMVLDDLGNLQGVVTDGSLRAALTGMLA